MPFCFIDLAVVGRRVAVAADKVATNACNDFVPSILHMCTDCWRRISPGAQVVIDKTPPQPLSATVHCLGPDVAVSMQVRDLAPFVRVYLVCISRHRCRRRRRPCLSSALLDDANHSVIQSDDLCSGSTFSILLPLEMPVSLGDGDNLFSLILTPTHTHIRTHSLFIPCRVPGVIS